jgi:zinc/manganese transport system substrate-binding protein
MLSSNPPDRAGRSVRRRPGRTVAAVIVASLALAACTTSSPGATSGPGASGPTGTVIQAVASINAWGSIAGQIGGSHVHMVSIITNPNQDPHVYEPTAADARTIAGAQLVIENGIGYDPWMPKLLAADGGNPTVLDVGALVGVADGGNPHRWYNPTDVRTVIRQTVTDFQRLDPADRTYFAQRATWFETVALKGYNTTIAAVRAKYANTPVGASESIFSMLAPALGLDLITPYSFLKAISEGTDVSAADTQTIDDQITHHLIKIYVYNSQNVTPDVQAQLTQVKAEHIPFATITETLAPANATYQAWQTRQVLDIEAALAKAARGGQS